MKDAPPRSYVFHRTLTSQLPVIVGGDGNYLIDDTGKRYLDACCGAAVSCLGHDHPVVRAAIKAQVDTLAFAHTGLFTNGPAEALSEFLITRAPEGTGHGRVMFLGSGSEAMEAALKLARQYCVERGETARSKIIASKPSYHGNTLGALATGGHAGRRAPFDPLLMDVSHIDATYGYRLQHDDETAAAFGLRMANQLEERINELGPESVMAFVAEPVVGASLGTQPPPTGYFKRIRDVIEAGSGRLWNGHTYMSHAIATAGALAVQQVIEDDGLLGKVKELGDQLLSGLRTRFELHAHIGDIRGRGLFWTIELVADRHSKAPFPVEKRLAIRVQEEALERGIIVYPSQGCADGVAGDHVLLAPSYLSSPEEIDLITETLADAVAAAIGAIG